MALSPDNTNLWEKHVPLYLSIAVLYILIYIFLRVGDSGKWISEKTDFNQNRKLKFD
jgi:hypothetical protein